MILRSCLLTVLLSLSLPAASARHYDLIIRNARVINGSGNPWFYADVAIDSGRIARIGDLSDSVGRTIVDAQQRILAPGFIDVHTHVETRRTGDIERFPDALNFLMDGVTTIVTGNCGSSEVDIGGWLTSLEKEGLGLNLASLIGHNSVRRRVMGEENRPATDAELRQMADLVDRAMKQGAVGLSTGLLYVPGTFADTREIVYLAKVAGGHQGIYATHLREQGAGLVDSITEAAEVGRQARLPVQISHFKIKGKQRWGTIGQALDLIENFRDRGIDVRADVYPYDRSSTGLSTTLPRWALEGGNAALQARLQDPVQRQRIVEGMRTLLEETGFPDYSYATVASFAAVPQLEGLTIRQINLAKGRGDSLPEQMDTILEMMAQGGARMIFHLMDDRDVATILKARYTAVASDGGVCQRGLGKPHPRSYGTNARVVHEYVARRAVLTLEDAIRKMTSLPAESLRFRGRGLVEEGYAADLLLFNPENVQDRATFSEPHHYSTGFDYVWVNGTAVVEKGIPTGKRPGRVLRSIAFSDDSP